MIHLECAIGFSYLKSMPELPEVEVVRQGLSQALNPSQIPSPKLIGIHFFREDLRDSIPIASCLSLVGQTLKSVNRRAKYLIFQFPTGNLISHLGMTGTWRVVRTEEAKEHVHRTHDHICLNFSKLKLIYNDPRRFGIFDFYQGDLSNYRRFIELGPEPLDQNWGVEQLANSLRGKTVAIKTALMDQRVVVGVGNIYACEILYRSGVRPQRSARRVRREELQRIVTETKLVLAESIRQGGSSISDFHGIEEAGGLFQLSHLVYDRAGKPCQKCGQAIQKKVLNGRSSFWCRRCQV